MYDAVIAGGGLSGLSLAAHLAAGGWGGRRVLVVDDDTAPHAQCWGSWAAGPGLLDAAVSRRYDRVRLHAAGASHVVALAPYRYRLVRRADLRAVVLDRLRRCPGFEVRPGHVQRVASDDDGAEVVVDGVPVRAAWAFDSVSRAPAAAPDARLAFTGWEVHCARPVFDPATPVLFDFRTARGFVYVLPDDPYRALVEVTEFASRSTPPATAAERDAALAAYLRDAGPYRIVRRESAVLPLRTRPLPRATGRVLAIGARAGLVRATTGYAYERIQRDSAAIAASLARHGHPFGPPRPGSRRRHRLLDAVLLDVLERDPAQLERAFARLFARNPAGRVLRFLDEDTTPLDELRLVAALPPGPYVRAAARRVRTFALPPGPARG